MLARKCSFLDANTGPMYRDCGIGERHALSPGIQSEQRRGSTERCGMERALPTRATDPSGKAITIANQEDLSLALASNQ